MSYNIYFACAVVLDLKHMAQRQKQALRNDELRPIYISDGDEQYNNSVD
jgi:hypothetical protein